MDILNLIPKRPLRAACAAALGLAVPAAGIALPAVPAAAQTNELDRVVAALRGISTLKADFTQTDRTGQTLRGELTMKRPGRIRFEYSDANMLVVADGGSLTYIDYDVQQKERWPIGDSPLGALLDPSRDVKRYGSLVPTSGNGVIGVEVRDVDKPEYGIITLIFVEKPGAPGGLELASWVALDAQNHRTTVRLSNQRYGVSVPNSAFRYREPGNSSRRPG